MGMMARMRSLAPWFILLVGGLFVLFMVISDSGALEFFEQQAQNVGSIDGEEVSYQEYSTLVDRARQQQEQATQTSIDESQMDFFRDQVWDALITKKLLDKKIKQYGIVVNDEEIRNHILGPNPPAFLRQQFTDSLGNFNRQLYDQTLLDPRNKEIMVGLEDQIREQITQEKLENIITASITVSEQEVKDKFVMQNTKMRANYIMIDPNTFLENEIKVEDADLKKYYDQHMEDYKIEPSRVLKYVLFRRLPSTADSVGIQKNLEALVAKMKTDTASFKSYVDIYSENPYSKDTLAISALDNQSRDLLSKANVGEVVGPALNYDGYVVYKLVAKTKSQNEMVRASHILVRSTGNDEADKKKADEIYSELMKGADFGSVAALKSDDGTRSNGGDLGWFGKNQMVKEFEDACYNGKVGVIQKPIKTTFGYHVIKVTGKSNDSYVVEKIVNKIQVSGSTVDKLYQDAEDFSFVAKENGFESEAKILKYDVIETPPITETSQSIPGLGMGTALVKWSFDNGVGEISSVFRVSSGYAVVMISDAIKAGFKKFEDVQALVKNSVIREKRFEKALAVAKDIRSKVGDNGDKNIAKSIYAMSRVDSTAEFTTLGSVPGLGRDFGFTEYAVKGDLKKWSKPIKGTLGVYLINVTYRTIFDASVFEAQKTAIRKELIQQKRNRYFNQWVTDLKKEGKIVDNRYLFFR